MDDDDFNDGSFHSETVSLLILNELRLMRRDMKAGMVRLETKMDDLIINKSKLKCLNHMKPAVPAKKSKHSLTSISAKSKYINKSRIDNRSKSPQDEKEAICESKTNAGEEPEFCTVQVDMSEFPVIDNEGIVLNYETGELDGEIDLSDYTSKKRDQKKSKKVASVPADENGRYQCSLCENSYTNKGNLRRHFRQHTGEMRYQCDVCERRFFRNEYLVRHMRKHVKNSKQQAQEKENESNKCNNCSKTFGDPVNLKRHMRAHNIKKLIPCLKCNKKFLKDELLQQHILKVHSQNKE